MIIEIKVAPSSGKQEIVLDKSLKLKCFLKAAPEKGAANQELIKILSQVLKITQKDIQIISGLTARKKRLQINNLTEEQFWKILGFEDIKLQKKFL